jgi:hypothetical protein
MSDVLLLFFSGLVALSTLVYAVLTWKLVTETRRMREAQTEPKVSVFVELNDHVSRGVDLVIRNVGQGPAFDIRFAFQGDPAVFADDCPLDQLPIIKNGLSYLAPNQTFRFMLGVLVGQYFERAMRSSWSFDVTYGNEAGRSRRDSYTVDFSQFAQLYVGGRAPLHRIERHLEALQRDVHHLTTGFSQLRVITQTAQEARREMEEFPNEQSSRSAAEGDDRADTKPSSAPLDT